MSSQEELNCCYLAVIKVKFSFQLMSSDRWYSMENLVADTHQASKRVYYL